MIMKSGDLFKFLKPDSRAECEPEDRVYDELLKRWIYIKSNVFVFFTYIEYVSDDHVWKCFLCFSNGTHIYYVRANSLGEISFFHAGGHVGSTQVIK